MSSSRPRSGTTTSGVRLADSRSTERFTTSKKKRKMPAIADTSDSDESVVAIIPRPSGSIRERLLALARPRALSVTDPNRRFNPDILMTIADVLVEAKEYKTVLNLALTSRCLSNGLKSYLQHMRKRVILRLEDLKLSRSQNWHQVKYIECHRTSPYPIDRNLPKDRQTEQKELIKKKLCPTVLLFKSEPHESAFRLCAELFPSIKVIRFLPDPLSQDLDCIFVSSSTKVGESFLELMNRKVPYYRPASPGYPNYYYVPASNAPKIKVLEYLKKGFEHRDLSSLPHRQIQSSILLKGSAGLDYYTEDWEKYEDSTACLESMLATSYMEKHINILDRPDLQEIAINVYLKASVAPHHIPHVAALITAQGQWKANLTTIFDKVDAMAKTHLSKKATGATLEFRLYLIHGSSAVTNPPVIRRPDYSLHEVQGRVDNQEDDVSLHGSDSSDDEDDDTGEDVQVAREQPPVFILVFTQSGGTIRPTVSVIDRDVLGCSYNGGCSRCRPEREE